MIVEWKTINKNLWCIQKSKGREKKSNHLETIKRKEKEKEIFILGMQEIESGIQSTRIKNIVHFHKSAFSVGALSLAIRK